MVIVIVVEMIVGRTQKLFFGGMFGFFAEQCLAVFLGNLVIVGVNFAEREESVATATIVDKRRLKRRFDPRNFG